MDSAERQFCKIQSRLISIWFTGLATAKDEPKYPDAGKSHETNNHPFKTGHVRSIVVLAILESDSQIPTHYPRVLAQILEFPKEIAIIILMCLSKGIRRVRRPLPTRQA